MQWRTNVTDNHFTDKLSHRQGISDLEWVRIRLEDFKTVGEITVGEMVVGETSVGEIIVGEMIVGFRSKSFLNN
uniref:Uncharacterized protein n=1 Tax=Rhizophagus irregularis (strain DAOM 181602 / DAOM 197198 / MUCL 43194) TaxID=747089 RepID=U9UQG3_RHIID